MKYLKYILTLLILLTAYAVEVNAEKYKGSVGPYPITMTLNMDDNADLASILEVNGSYIYDQAGNRLYLSGYYYAPWTDNPGYILEEHTAKGKKSGVWKLHDDNNGGLTGSFKNSSTGKTFKVILRPAK